MSPLEMFGYLGSFVVAISLMMKNIVKLRWINLAGAVIFSIYGLIVKAYPVFVLNAFIAFADIYYLFLIYTKKDSFSILELEKDNVYLQRFLSFYQKDIEKFFPQLKSEDIITFNSIFILRNLLPVGLVVYKQNSETEAEIVLDYAIPDYRDLGNSRFLLFSGNNIFKSNGIKKLTAFSNNDIHINYLKKLGFKKSDDSGSYHLILD